MECILFSMKLYVCMTDNQCCYFVFVCSYSFTDNILLAPVYDILVSLIEVAFMFLENVKILTFDLSRSDLR